ncbi:GFA family protein [Ketobacter sp. MCCC 1A13808]|nr:GFA family protein [Ketobacter sp. MCCC 1A13808]
MLVAYFGSCLCGQIKYKVTSFEKDMAHCHCSMCRKFHGSAFATFGEVRAENFEWASGHGKLKSYTAHNGTVRKLCDVCGSSLIFESEASKRGGVLEIAIASLDEGSGLLPVLREKDVKFGGS